MSRSTRVASDVWATALEPIFPLEKCQYQLLHLVGRGEYGQSEVHAARCLSNGRTVAAKLIDLENYSLDLDQLRKETAFWSTCQHPNVIAYYGSFISDSILWCIMEYMDGGSVANILQFGYAKGFPDESVIASILHELLQFLSYFHDRRQIHRAICTNNVLLTSQGEVKIGDLGSATELIRAGQRVRATFTVMDSSYSAPEGMVEGKGYGPAADIWSVGILAYAMAAGRDPFDSLPPLAKVQAIVSGPSPELPVGSYSSQLRDFVHQCLQRDPARRPTASALLKHSFVKKTKGCEFLRTTIMANLPPLSQRFDVLLNRGPSDALATAHKNRQPPISFDFSLDGAEKQETPEPPPAKPEVSETIQGRFRVIRQPAPQPVGTKKSDATDNQAARNRPHPVPVPQELASAAQRPDYRHVSAAVATAKDVAGDLEKDQDDLAEELKQLEAEAKLMTDGK